MSEQDTPQRVTLLTCEAAGCNNTFDVIENPELPEAARSLAAALEAHKAGWFAAGGPILCPACAARAKQEQG